MSNRNSKARRTAIVERLERVGEVTVDELATEFDISEVTIRKDLAALETEGHLVRRYGGAVSCTPPAPLAEVSKSKTLIAEAASRLIQDDSRILIDSGATTEALLPLLDNRKNLVVMTNSLAVAYQLSALDNGPTLLMTGGTWDARSRSFQGQIAEQLLTAYDFDQLFIGADGLDMARGTTTFNELYSLSQVMADVASQVVVMAESHKFDRKMHNLELPWQKIDVLITDGDLEDHRLNSLESMNIQVIRA